MKLNLLTSQLLLKTISFSSCMYAVVFSLTASVRIFREHKDTGTKYKSRVRSRVSNLGDLKNPSLRERVISGDITPAQIATMTTEV